MCNLRLTIIVDGDLKFAVSQGQNFSHQVPDSRQSHLPNECGLQRHVGRSMKTSEKWNKLLLKLDKLCSLSSQT